ncbi:MAG: putative Ig domain-containing protein, partial [Methanolobus sp.]|nr:putative Ig domain-containing protein [Methanolobus sp.]
MFRGETKNCKKICFLLIGIVLMLSMLPVLAGADSDGKLTIGSIVVNPNSSFSLPLFIENATGVQSVAMDIFFEKSGLQMTSIDNNSLSDSKLEYLIDNSSGFANMTISSANIKTEEKTNAADFNFLAINSGNYTIVLQNVSLENDTTIYPAQTVINGSVRVNHPPQMDDIDDMFVNVSSDLNFAINATDEDDDELYYNVTDLPAGYYLNSATGFFNWTPTENDTGTHYVKFSVDDGYATDFTHANITVYNHSEHLPSVVNDIEVNGPTSIEIPASGDVIETYTATVLDQYGTVMSGESVTWDLSEAVSGVSVGLGGQVTVT